MFIEINNLKKSYGQNDSAVQVLNGVNMSVDKGQMCVIQGSSGSGKSQKKEYIKVSLVTVFCQALYWSQFVG